MHGWALLGCRSALAARWSSTDSAFRVRNSAIPSDHQGPHASGHIVTHDDEVLDAVWLALANTLSRAGRPPVRTEDLRLETRLTEDLGFDSMLLFDLTLELEDALGVPEFPMEDWISQQLGYPDDAFTVASLVRLSAQLLPKV